jgi:hypothetical protein
MRAVPGYGTDKISLDIRQERNIFNLGEKIK